MHILRHSVGLLLLVLASTSAAGEPWRGPFASVVLHGDVIRATFPSSGGRWAVLLNSKPSHISNYGETLILRRGDTLVLAEHHCSSRITPRFALEKPGLEITTTCHTPIPPKYESTETTFVPATQ
jgi:hypothetical protein